MRYAFHDTRDMRLTIDARMMGAGNTRGIGRYIKEVTDHLRPLLDSNDELVLLEPKISWYGLAEQFKMPFVFRRAKADLVWVPHWNVPLLYRGPLAITIHDLLLVHQPASAKASTRGSIISSIKRIGHRIILANAVRRARVIFVPTQAVADDVRAHFPSASSKLIVTGEGLSSLPRATHYSLLTTHYLLYVGSAYPHKRLDLLVAAWSVTAEKHPALSLVITGKEDVFLGRIKKLVEERRIPRVHFAGPVDDQELAALYAHATLFAFPTSFEGFGLPPIEALAAGTPAVVSDIPVLREVLPTEGVFFFKNGDKDDMIRAIETALAAGSQGREAAARGGEEARRRWTWEQVARLTLDGLTHAQGQTLHTKDEPKKRSDMEAHE